MVLLEVLSKRVWETCRRSNLDTRVGQEAVKDNLLATINAGPEMNSALAGAQLAYSYKGYAIEINFMPEGADINIRRSGTKK